MKHGAKYALIKYRNSFRGQVDFNERCNFVCLDAQGNCAGWFFAWNRKHEDTVLAHANLTITSSVISPDLTSLLQTQGYLLKYKSK